MTFSGICVDAVSTITRTTTKGIRRARASLRLSAALHVSRDRLSSLGQCPLCVGSVDDRFAFKQRIGANGILGRQSLMELSVPFDS